MGWDQRRLISTIPSAMRNHRARIVKTAVTAQRYVAYVSRTLYFVPLVSLRFLLPTSGTRLVVDEHHLGLSPFVSHFSLFPPPPRFIKELVLLVLSPSRELHSFLPVWV